MVFYSNKKLKVFAVHGSKFVIPLNFISISVSLFSTAFVHAYPVFIQRYSVLVFHFLLSCEFLVLFFKFNFYFVSIFPFVYVLARFLENLPSTISLYWLNLRLLASFLAFTARQLLSHFNNLISTLLFYSFLSRLFSLGFRNFIFILLFHYLSRLFQRTSLIYYFILLIESFCSKFICLLFMCA